MSPSQALVPYRATSSALSPLTSSSRSLSTFTTTTGTAIATELLYRLLIDIINRLLSSLNRFASHRIDQFSTYIERRWKELAEQRRAVPSAKDGGGPGVVDEVNKMVERRGGVGFGVACPMGGAGDGNEMGMGRRGPPPPPVWVQGVLEGMEDGRISQRDIYMNNLVG